MNQSGPLSTCRGTCRPCVIGATTSILEFPFEVATGTLTVATYITGLPDGTNSTFLSTVTGQSNRTTAWNSSAVTVTVFDESAPLVWTIDGVELTSGTTYAQFTDFSGAFAPTTQCTPIAPTQSLQLPAATDLIVPVTGYVPDAVIISVGQYLNNIEPLVDQLGGNKPADCFSARALLPTVEPPCVSIGSTVSTSCTTNLLNKTSCAVSTIKTTATVPGTTNHLSSLTSVPGYPKESALSLTYITDSIPRWLGGGGSRQPAEPSKPPAQQNPTPPKPLPILHNPGPTSPENPGPTKPPQQSRPNSPPQPPQQSGPDGVQVHPGITGGEASRPNNSPPQQTPPPQQHPNPGPITASPFTVSNDGSGVIIGGTTIHNGASTVINGIPISVASDGGHVVVGSSTTNLPSGAQIAITPLGSSPANSPGQLTASRDGSGDVVVEGQTIKAGATTMIDGVPITVLPDGSGVVIGSSTTKLGEGDEIVVTAPPGSTPTGSRGSSDEDPLTISRDGSSIIVDDEHTIQEGRTITEDGHTIVALTSGTIVIDSATTTSLDDGEEVTITASPGASHTARFSSTTGVGDYIMSGVKPGDGPTSSGDAESSTRSNAAVTGRATGMGAWGLAGIVLVMFWAM